MFSVSTRHFNLVCKSSLNVSCIWELSGHRCDVFIPSPRLLILFVELVVDRLYQSEGFLLWTKLQPMLMSMSWLWGIVSTICWCHILAELLSIRQSIYVGSDGGPNDWVDPPILFARASRFFMCNKIFFRIFLFVLGIQKWDYLFASWRHPLNAAEYLLLKWCTRSEILQFRVYFGLHEKQVSECS